MPTDPCFSIKTVEAPSLACSFRAIARPTTPPPITACVKSASLLVLEEKCRLVDASSMDLEKARVSIMVASNRSTAAKKPQRPLYKRQCAAKKGSKTMRDVRQSNPERSMLIKEQSPAIRGDVTRLVPGASALIGLVASLASSNSRYRSLYT